MKSIVSVPHIYELVKASIRRKHKECFWKGMTGCLTELFISIGILFPNFEEFHLHNFQIYQKWTFWNFLVSNIYVNFSKCINNISHHEISVIPDNKPQVKVQVIIASDQSVKQICLIWVCIENKCFGHPGSLSVLSFIDH